MCCNLLKITASKQDKLYDIYFVHFYQFLFVITDDKTQTVAVNSIFIIFAEWRNLEIVSFCSELASMGSKNVSSSP
jgi:hypothetical protein